MIFSTVVTSLFKEQSSASIFWLIAVSLAVHSYFFIQPPQVLLPNEDEILANIMMPLTALSPMVIMFIYYLIILVQALRLNYLLNDLKMFPRPTFVTAWSYILLSALYPAWNNITPALLMNIFLIWLIYRLAKLHSSQKPKTDIYNIGLITGLMVMLYNPTVPIVLLVFWALGILRPFHLNEWFVLLMAIITPFYFLAGVVFLRDDFKNILKYLPEFHWHLMNPQHEITMLITTIAIALLVLIGFIIWQNNNGRMIIQARKNWAVLLLMFIFLIPGVFIIINAPFDCLLLCTVPAAALTANAFFYPKNLFPSILFWCLLGAVLLNTWYYAAR